MYLCACHTFQYWVRLKYLSLDLLLGELAADLCQVLEDQLGALSLACPGFPAGEGEEKKCKLFSVHFTIHSSFYNSEKKKNARQAEIISLNALSKVILYILRRFSGSAH